MSDERRRQGPTPLLRTRPATVLTAIGLCLFIMVIQLMPGFRDFGSRAPANTDVGVRMPMSMDKALPASAITR